MNAASAKLSVWKDGAKVQEFDFQGEGFLGRERECAVRIEDRAISRKHAWLRVIPGGRVELRRQSEFGAMKVNGEDRTEAVLKPGESVEVGPYRLSLESATQEPSSAVPAEEEASAPAPITPEVPETIPLPEPVEAKEEIAPEESSAREIEISPSDGELSVYREDPASSVPSNTMTKTQALSMTHLEAKLIFPQNAANPNVVVIGDGDIVIGRSRSCTVMLNDKKCSRRNTLIRREGAQFKIRDLESVNGTFLNKKRIQEADLSGDDEIQVGDVVFHIRVIDKDFKASDSAPETSPSVELGSSVMASPPPPAQPAPALPSSALPFDWSPGPEASGEIPDLENVEEHIAPPPMPTSAQAHQTQMPPTPFPPQSASPAKRKTLMERYRAQPQWKQMVIGIAALAFVWWFLEDEPVEAPKQTQKQAAAPSAQVATTAKPAGPSFELLNAEQKRFVEAQHQLAFDLYRGKEYDKSIFEIRKIFGLIPDYKDSKEIERYALEGKKKLELLEAERIKKEEEARIRTQVALLEEKARTFISKRKHEEAAKLFPEILALDPENQKVSAWQSEIEIQEREMKEERERREVQKAINQEAWGMYQRALETFRSGNYYKAERMLTKILKKGADDQKLMGLVKRKIEESREEHERQQIALFQDAKNLEMSGETSKAYSLYEKIVAEDPARATDAEEAMKRIDDGINDRAKVSYTEAVLAESFSDFELAKTKFQEIVQTTPEHNLYHKRAQTKLGRYLAFEHPKVKTE